MIMTHPHAPSLAYSRLTGPQPTASTTKIQSQANPEPIRAAPGLMDSLGCGAEPVLEAWLFFDTMRSIPWILYPGSRVPSMGLPHEYSACHHASLYSACYEDP